MIVHARRPMRWYDLLNDFKFHLATQVRSSELSLNHLHTEQDKHRREPFLFPAQAWGRAEEN